MTDGWTTLDAVAALGGCSHAAVARAIQQDQIVQRPGPRSQAFLEHNSALAWVSAHRARVEERAQQRPEHDRLRELVGRPDLKHDG